MLSKKAWIGIVCLSKERLSSTAASSASKAASKVVSKAAGVAPAPAPARRSKTPTSPKVKTAPKLRPVSSELKQFLGGTAESNLNDVVKAVWGYIRKHDLQDPADGKQVNCDAKLKTVLGKDRVSFLEIPGLVSSHLHKAGKK